MNTELLKKRAKVLREAEKVRKDAGGELGRAGERATYETLFRRFDDLTTQAISSWAEEDTILGGGTEVPRLSHAMLTDDQLDRPEYLDALERKLLAELKRSTGNPVIGGSLPLSESELSGFEITKARSRKFRGMFCASDAQKLSNGGFKSFGEFAKTLAAGLHHPGLVMLTATVANDPSGGFLVPEQSSAMLLDGSLENEIVRPLATVYPMISMTRTIPAWDGNDHTTDLAGFSGQWMAEAGAGTNQTPKTRKMLLTAHKLAIFTQMSNELLTDASDFEQNLGDRITKAIGWYLDRACLTGNGVGKPMGILNAPSIVTVDPEENQNDATILYENVIKMYARLAPSCKQNAVWIASNDIIPELLSMTSPSGNLIWNQSGSAETAPTTLLGRPLLFTEKTPALGTKGDLILVDLSQYAMGLRAELSLEKSNAPGWQNDLMSFRMIIRVEGMPTWDKAITPAGGGDTLSWCVVLGDR